MVLDLGWKRSRTIVECYVIDCCELHSTLVPMHEFIFNRMPMCNHGLGVVNYQPLKGLAFVAGAGSLHV
jgi:hypothetical protein